MGVIGLGKNNDFIEVVAEVLSASNDVFVHNDIVENLAGIGEEIA